MNRSRVLIQTMFTLASASLGLVAALVVLARTASRIGGAAVIEREAEG